MTRATRVLGSISVLLIIWLTLLYNILPIQLNHTFQSQVLPLLPLYALITFGCYSLSVIAINLIQFNDVSYASKSLDMDIQHAKQRLINNGYKFT